MIYDLTVSIKTTSSGTRVYAFLVDASFVEGAFGTCNTLRSTRWWASDVTGNTRTHSLPVYFSTLTVGATR